MKKLIGSRAWGGHTEESDYDYACDMDTFDKAIQEHNLEDEVGDNYNGKPFNILFNDFNVKFKSKSGRIINLLGYSDANLQKALDTYDIVESLSKIMDLSDREVRHDMCQSVFRNAFKDIF